MILNRFHTFSGRLLTLFVVIAILPILSVIAVAIVVCDHLIGEMAVQKIADVRDEKVKHLCAWQTRTEADLRFFGNTLRTHHHGATNRIPDYLPPLLMHYLSTHPEAHALALADGTSGAILFSTDSTAFSNNISKTAAFTQALRTHANALFLADNPSSKQPSLFDFAYPVHNGTNTCETRPDVVLLYTINFEKWSAPFAAHINLGQTGEVLLLPRDAKMRLTPEKAPYLNARFKRFIDLLMHHMGFLHANSRDTMQFLDQHGHAVIAAVATIPSLDLRLIAKQDRSEIYAVMSQCLAVIVLLIPGILLVLVPIARQLARRVTEPFGIIKAVAEQLHAGNLSARTSIKRNDEIGDVARALDTAAETIERETSKRAAIIQKVEEELYRAQRMDSIGNLAGGIAHDFNNMLQAILGFAELLEIDTAGNPELHDNVREVQRAATRAKDLTHQLLAFAHKQVSMPVVLQINSLLTSSENTFKRLLHVDTTLKFQLDPCVAAIYTDPTQLQQILMNLIANANDARHPHTKQVITVSTSMAEIKTPMNTNAVPGAYVKLSVNDQGIGIRPDTLTKIFDPFFTTKAPGKGLGLGLSVVDSFIRSQKGWVTVDSTIDHGTTFDLFLPAVLENNAQVQRVCTFHNLQNFKGNGHTILIVEDEEVLRNITTHHLAAAGYTVLASDGVQQAETLWKAHKKSIDIIVCDIVLDDGNGLAFSAALRPEAPNLPILLVSGYSQDVLNKDTLVNNRLRFLAKPYSSKALLNEIAFLLSSNT